MHIGLIGLPGCGKTTIFSALTGQSAVPAAVRKPHLAEVSVPDRRVETLADLFKKDKRIHPSVQIRDLPVEADAQGALSSATLAELRTLDALALVVRAFLDPAVPHPLETVDPARDLARLLDSLAFGDYAIAEARMERLVKEGKKASREYHALETLSQHLASGRFDARSAIGHDGEQALAGFAFLTFKPGIVVVNAGERSADTQAVLERAAALGLDLFVIQGQQEMEIARLAGPDQSAFLADLGLSEPSRDRFLATLYHSLNLISFLTVGDKEVRAWSMPRGASALKAAGRIHTDMEKGFIRAEVIGFDQLLAEGGFAQARKSGRLRLEGKEYTVQDGDVITIRFNL